jgi:hypothetical protein
VLMDGSADSRQPKNFKVYIQPRASSDAVSKIDPWVGVLYGLYGMETGESRATVEQTDCPLLLTVGKVPYQEYSTG